YSLCGSSDANRKSNKDIVRGSWDILRRNWDILRRNKDVLRKHVCKLDDRPGERADVGVHNTVHSHVTTLAVAPQGPHSLGTIEARRAPQPITRHHRRSQAY